MKRFWISVFVMNFLIANFGINAQTNNTALVVTLHPEEINGLDARWKVRELGDEWYLSGKMLVLPQGDYTVEFKGDIKGWRAPASRQVTLVQGKTTEIAGIYERLKGSLKVTISPSEVVNEGAQWRRVGQEVWRNDGEIETDVPVAEYEIEFKKVPGWNVPEKTVVDLQSDITNNISGTYSREQGKLMVNISPKEAVKAGAMWRLGGETTFRDSGVTITKEIGQYWVEFMDIPNWVKPNSLQVNVVANEKVTLSAEYKPISSQEGEGITEGEGEGEGEKPFPFPCGCEQKRGIGGIKQFLGNLLVLGMSFILLGSWTAMAKKRKSK